MAVVERLNGKGIKLKKFEDVVFPYADGVDPQTAIKYHSDFRYKRGDILSCSYPKCGFHWIHSMLEKLKSPEDSDRPRDMFIELVPQKDIDNQTEPRILSTHFKPSRFHPSHTGNNGKIVLIFRNPKDVAVSYYHHFKNASFTKSQQSWDEFFESFIEGEVPLGSYFSYLKEWEGVLKNISEGNSNMNVEVFYYEDLLLNPEQNIARLNSFLGFGRDADYLQRVLKETTLVALQEHYKRNDHLGNPFCLDDEGKSIIFRKGRVGDWKNYFTVSQSERVDALLRDALKHDIIKFKYDM